MQFLVWTMWIFRLQEPICMNESCVFWNKHIQLAAPEEHCVKESAESLVQTTYSIYKFQLQHEKILTFLNLHHRLLHFPDPDPSTSLILLPNSPEFSLHLQFSLLHGGDSTPQVFPSITNTLIFVPPLRKGPSTDWTILTRFKLWQLFHGETTVVYLICTWLWDRYIR